MGILEENQRGISGGELEWELCRGIIVGILEENQSKGGNFGGEL